VDSARYCAALCSHKEQQHKHLPAVGCNYRIGIRVNRWNNINNMQAVI
jgi:hypothetical protein